MVVDNYDFVPLKWYNVAIASIFIVVNGKKNNAQPATFDIGTIQL